MTTTISFDFDASAAPARLRAQSHLGHWTSPRFGVRFAAIDDRLQLVLPCGEPFLSSVELDQRLAEARAERAAADCVDRGSAESPDGSQGRPLGGLKGPGP